MLPAYRTQVIKVPSECTKQVSNPEYLAQYHQLSDACEKNLEKETFDRRMLKFQAVMDCADEKARDKIKVPEKLEQKYPCEEEKQETWFWALNKYWFKIGSETK